MNRTKPEVARCDTVRLPGEIVSVSISEDGSTIVAASTRAIGFWRVGSKSAEFIITPSEALSCSVSEDGLSAVSTHIDGSLKLWDVATKRCQTTIPVGFSRECIILSEKILALVSTKNRSEIVCVDWASAGRSSPRRFCHSGEIRKLCASDTLGVMAAAYKPTDCLTSSAHLMIQNFRGSRRARFIYSTISLPIRLVHIDVAKNAPFIVVNDNNGLRVFNSKSSRLDFVLERNSSNSTTHNRNTLCAITACGELVVDTRNATVRLWSVAKRALLACVETENNSIRDIAISGHVVVVGGTKGNVSVFDTSVFVGCFDRSLAWILPECECGQYEELFCPICQDSIKIGDRVIQLPCGHVFHYKCMHKYLAEDGRPRCPLDRKQVHRWTLQYLPIWNWDGVL